MTFEQLREYVEYLRSEIMDSDDYEYREALREELQADDMLLGNAIADEADERSFDFMNDDTLEVTKSYDLANSWFLSGHNVAIFLGDEYVTTWNHEYIVLD